MLQLGRLLTGLHELVQTSLPQGSSIVAVLRVLTRTYNILTTLAKYVGHITYLNLDFSEVCQTFFFLPSVVHTGMLDPAEYAPTTL